VFCINSSLDVLYAAMYLFYLTNVMDYYFLLIAIGSQRKYDVHCGILFLLKPNLFIG
jgi:hypothetical protein